MPPTTGTTGTPSNDTRVPRSHLDAIRDLLAEALETETTETLERDAEESDGSR